MYTTIYEYHAISGATAVSTLSLVAALVLVMRGRSVLIRGVGLLWVLLFASFTVNLIIWSWRDSVSIRKAARNGTIGVVEGEVRDFSPQPFEGHRDETFMVDSVRFTYSQYVGRGGFHTSASHGGSIRQGLRVRIQYLPDGSNNRIIRLEIRH